MSICCRNSATLVSRNGAAGKAAGDMDRGPQRRDALIEARHDRLVGQIAGDREPHVLALLQPAALLLRFVQARHVTDCAGCRQCLDRGGAERTRSAADDDVTIAEVHAPSSPICHSGDNNQAIPVGSLMPKRRRNAPFPSLQGTLFGVKQRKGIPHEFVLGAIAPLSSKTLPMFGCLAVYVEDKIMLILREKSDKTADNGVWLATAEDHHQSLRCEFPNMRSIQVFGKDVTGWQVLPADAPDFEEAALRACELIIARDPRIGKVPGERRVLGSGAKKAAKSRERVKSLNEAAQGCSRS